MGCQIVLINSSLLYRPMHKLKYTYRFIGIISTIDLSTTLSTGFWSHNSRSSMGRP